jgi:hypothetical protein
MGGRRTCILLVLLVILHDNKGSSQLCRACFTSDGCMKTVNYADFDARNPCGARDVWRVAISSRPEEGVRRIEVDELHALARLGHHLSDCVPPRLVMRRFLVRRRGLGRAICLDQHEAGRIIRSLENVKARDPRFLPAGLRIRDGRTLKSLNEVWFHFHIHMND